MKRLIAASLLAVSCTRAFAIGMVDIVPDPATTWNNGTGYSLGWTFTVNVPVLVQALGYYDYTGDDLVEGHEVGIYDSSLTLLVAGFVAPGDPLDSGFRYTACAPTPLLPGEYVIMGSSGLVDEYAWSPASLWVDPRITYGVDQFAVGNFLQPPTSSNGIVGYFGPNFKTESVPEPATMALGLGLLGLVARRRSAKN
ncbi:MAG: PEP-CTERM sorting domain-containing protein [Fimbriimonadaceae bacterium]|nr:PEP-CTERM sorting domain-containing protein [Fimbriimonadaceae bacterium]